MPYGRMTRSQAIHQKCIECCNDQPHEVRKCESTRCALWRYRTGREEDDELKPRKKDVDNDK